MKKHVFISLLAAFVATITLSSCSTHKKSSSNVSNDSISSNPSSDSSQSNSGDVHNYRKEPMIISDNHATESEFTFKFDSVTFKESDSLKNGENFYTPEQFAFDFREVRDDEDFDDPATVGNQRVLVIPVKFADDKSVSACNKLDGGCDKALDDIEKAFFGDPSYTGWESVSSYYYKSSYGKLKLQGRVTDWFHLNRTSTAVNSLSSTLYADPSFYVLREASKWYENNYGDLSYYDQDNDGLVDAVWLVYDRPYSRTGSDTWWAYTYWDFENTSRALKPYTYAWASVNFLYEGKYTKNGVLVPDAHTFIHETGHVLGLDDYYNYDDDSNYGAAGKIDMMDYNIGDHCAYSKMLLGWTMPKVVTGSTTISINPFESSGDCILLRDEKTWNKTPMDEYLLIEFVTPTGLNYQDSVVTYTGGVKHFSQPGIKIYHIDSRLAVYDAYGYFKNYTDSLTTSSRGESVSIAHSNTPSRSVSSNFLVHLLEATQINSFKNGAAANNDTLFVQGNQFTPTRFQSFFNNRTNLNDGTAIGYNISIDSITSNKATLTFTKI